MVEGWPSQRFRFTEAGIVGKLRKKRLNTLQKPKCDLGSVRSVSGCSSPLESVVSGAISKHLSYIR